MGIKTNKIYLLPTAFDVGLPCREPLALNPALAAAIILFLVFTVNRSSRYIDEASSCYRGACCLSGRH